MRRYMLLFLTSLLALALLPSQPAVSRAQQLQATPAVSLAGYRPGTVLVKFKPGKGLAGRAALAVQGLDVIQEIQGLGVLVVAVPVGQEASAAEQLSRQGDVAYAELDYAASAQAEPNDPSYIAGKQWGLAQIGAPQAWNVTTGAPAVVIAVIDSGTDLAHPDLAGKLWQNTAEIPNNGRDDELNGCIDDIYGCRFRTPEGAYGDGRVGDENGHGTHVAGIAAAATNNGIGVAGTAWGPQLMTVKVLGVSGSTALYSDVAAGILYAAGNGANIISLSLGGPSPSATLCDAVSTAVAKGKVVAAAAGNNDTVVYYPAMCPGALAVAATDPSDHPAAFSNPGARIDLAAPGTDIYSTWYYSGLGQHGYRSEGGTSQSVPFVAGAAALVWSRWPALTADGVKAQLLGAVQDVGMPGKDDETGWGRLDAAAAVSAPVQPVDLRLSASVVPQAVVAGNPLTATFSIANVGTASATSVSLSAVLPAEPAMDAVLFSAQSCRLNGRQMNCGVSRLDPGESVTIGVVVTPTVVGNGELTTTASAAAAQRELTPADNAQTVKSSIRPALWGRVFLDSNGDGIRQAWETRGVADAGLFLYQNDQPIAYTTSRAPDGYYGFDTLALGSYVLSADPLPEGYLLTTPQQIALAIEPARETTVYFGAWNGIAEPTPTPTPQHAARIYLPVVLR